MKTSRSAARERFYVWDPFVRLFHWTVVSGVFLAYFTEDFRSLHKAVGYAVLAAVGMRLLWGLVGSRHARFTDFVKSPKAILRYAAKVLRGREERHLGHNPLGGAMVVALLLLLLVIGVSGWMMTLDMFWGEDWVEDLHALSVDLLLFGLVPLHVAGVLFTSLRERTNLVKAMVTGFKEYGETGDSRPVPGDGVGAEGRV